MTTHHAQPEPHQCPEYRHRDGVEPQRPDEAQEEEVELDALPVLDDEDEQDCQAAQRGDRPAAESPGPLVSLPPADSSRPPKPRTAPAGRPSPGTRDYPLFHGLAMCSGCRRSRWHLHPRATAHSTTGHKVPGRAVEVLAGLPPPSWASQALAWIPGRSSSSSASFASSRGTSGQPGRAAGY